MTMTRLLTVALLSAVSFGTMSAANAVVPGSDTYERARDDAAVQSVVDGSAPAAQGYAVQNRSTFGFPNSTAAASNGALVPGSQSVEDSAERNDVMSVINGTPGANYVVVPGAAGGIVPGSDSF